MQNDFGFISAVPAAVVAQRNVFTGMNLQTAANIGATLPAQFQPHMDTIRAITNAGSAPVGQAPVPVAEATAKATATPIKLATRKAPTFTM